MVEAALMSGGDMAVDVPEHVTLTAPSAPTTTGHHDLGVLFVHGIGDQQQCATLARFGGALQRWLSRWLDVATRPAASRHTTPTATAAVTQEATRGAEDGSKPLAPGHQIEVVAVDHHPAGPGTPAHAEVRLRAGVVGSGEQSWLLAEAWWAPEVTPPRFGQFVRWVVPMLPWLAAVYAVAATSTDHSLSGVVERTSEGIERWTICGLLWLTSPAIAVVLMAVVLVWHCSSCRSSASGWRASS
jgi:hypothetical protein